MLKFLKKHITILCVVVFLTPTTIKLLHTFEGGHACSVACKLRDKKEKHHNDVKKDCEICSFHYTAFTIAVFSYISFISFNEISKYSSTYNSFRHYLITPFSLRGPPCFNNLFPLE